MKQWMKKGLAACLALVMCLSLAACGGDQEEERPQRILSPSGWQP